MEPQAESLELLNGRCMLKGGRGMRKLWSASYREGRGLVRWRVETFGGSGLGAQRVGVSRVFELAPRREAGGAAGSGGSGGDVPSSPDGVELNRRGLR